MLSAMRHRLVFLLVLAAIAVPAPAGEPDCTCLSGNACYHTLNSPVAPPDDPCSCPRCESARGTCPDRLPAGWNRDCATDTGIRCFLRRHAASWKIACSDRLDGKCGCRRPHPEWCPKCGTDGGDWGREGLEIVRRQIKVEQRILGKKRPFVVIKSPHFYLVTDIPRLRTKVQPGGVRDMTMHEIAHVYVQRAEMAYRDFIRHMGDRMTYERPCAIYLLEDERTKKRIAQQYFGNWEPELLYGADAKTIGGGYGYNGLAISNSKFREDEDLHFRMLHLLGHLFISTWVEGGGSVDICPRWMFVGAAHWLSRLPEKFETEAEFCDGEGYAVSDSGDRWHLKCRKYARERKSLPIQRILDEKTFEGLDLECHVRAWSWFDVFLREDRERFLNYLAAIRKGTDATTAMKAAFGCTPEEFDTRWRQRILGRRPTVAATSRELDAQDPDLPGARERAEIRTEKDPVVLASRIRALSAVNDRLTAATLVPLLSTKSENVREATVLVLSRSTSGEVREWLRTKGLERTGGTAKAHLVRIIGNLRDRQAVGALTACAGDAEWLVRANVVRALALVGDEASIPLIVERASDRAPKVRIAALDALAAFGRTASRGTAAAAAQLDASAWQLRSAAALCLGAIGRDDAVDPLIERMEKEGGRVHRDIRDALKRVTGDDLGGTARHWREWWRRERVRRAAGALPSEKPADAAPDGYAKKVPTYYGLRVFSARVGYVVDASYSMVFEIELDPAWLSRCGREYMPRGRKFELARAEIAASLAALDPRTLFNVYFFRTVAEQWKTRLVPATPGNRDSAVGRIDQMRPPITPQRTHGNLHKTNYVDVFRLLLDVKKEGIGPAFTDTPDTVFLLTDGKPSAGDITDSDTLLGWFREYNRFARIRVNVITFGKLESNPEFLRRPATENGGRFIEVPAVR
jgi:hypothetical protein